MSYITKTALVRAIDENLGKVERKAETSCGTVDVSELVLVIVDASAHTDGALSRWKDAAATAYNLGIRADMLVPRIPDGDKKTRKNPGCDRVLHESIRQAILAGISVNRTPQVHLTFPRLNASGADILAKKVAAHTWTIFEIANCPGAYLKGKQDPLGFVKERTTLNNCSGGTYMGRLTNYLLDLEYPTRRADAKAAKVAEKEAAEDAAAEDAAAKGAPLLDRMVLMLQEFNAQVLALKGANGQGLKGVIEAQQAGIELLVRVGQLLK